MSPQWPSAEPIETTRLSLEPLSPAHATAMVEVLADDALYTYTGGHPPTADELTVRYERQAIGHSPDGTQGWLNWVVRHTSSGNLVGTVQATLRPAAADIAWVIGTGSQGMGYATEAASAMVGWLFANSVPTCHAYIHPDHAASVGVARRLGMVPTGHVDDGERRWELVRPGRVQQGERASL